MNFSLFLPTVRAHAVAGVSAASHRSRARELDRLKRLLAFPRHLQQTPTGESAVGTHIVRARTTIGRLGSGIALRARQLEAAIGATTGPTVSTAAGGMKGASRKNTKR